MELRVRKRGSKWEYLFEVARVNGKRKTVSKSGFRTKGEALKAGTQAMHDYLNIGSVFKPSEMSMTDFLEEWLEASRSQWKPATYQGYLKQVRSYIEPRLGSYYLKSISAKVIQEYLNDLFNEGFSRNTLSNVKGRLTGSMDWAVRMEYIKYNPAKNARLPSPRAVPAQPTRRNPHCYIDRASWERIMERFPEGHPSHLPLMLGYWAGLRKGEAFGLCWEDVDFDAGTITVNRQIQYEKGGAAASKRGQTATLQTMFFTAPKYDSVRTIRISSQLLSLLRRTYAMQRRARLVYGPYYTEYHVDEERHLIEDPGDPDHRIHLVCCRENGTYVRPNTMQNTITVIQKRLGIDCDFHSLRKTHATMLLEAGANPKDVQHRLGHRTMHETLQIYAEVTPIMEDKSVELLEKM